MTGLLAVEGELHGVEDAILCAKKVKRRLSLSFDAALLSAFVASPCKVKLKEQATFRTHTTTQLAVQDRSVCHSVELQCGIVGLLVGGSGLGLAAWSGTMPQRSACGNSASAGERGAKRMPSRCARQSEVSTRAAWALRTPKTRWSK